jgi:hypothetical protein
MKVKCKFCGKKFEQKKTACNWMICPCGQIICARCGSGDILKENKNLKKSFIKCSKCKLQCCEKCQK